MADTLGYINYQEGADTLLLRIELGPKHFWDLIPEW